MLLPRLSRAHDSGEHRSKNDEAGRQNREDQFESDRVVIPVRIGEQRRQYRRDDGGYGGKFSQITEKHLPTLRIGNSPETFVEYEILPHEARQEDADMDSEESGRGR